MRKRPHTVTVIGIVFLVTGLIGLADVADRLATRGPLQHDLIWIGLVRLLGVIAAAFILRGRNWARWLLVIWMGFHVVLSAFHRPFELLPHAVLFAAVVYFLFRRSASRYFRAAANAST